MVEAESDITTAGTEADRVSTIILASLALLTRVEVEYFLDGAAKGF